MQIGSLLKNMRLDKGLTQKELADSSGVTQSMMSKVEKDEFENVTIGILRKLTTALHCPVIDLLPESDKKQL